MISNLTPVTRFGISNSIIPHWVVIPIRRWYMGWWGRKSYYEQASFKRETKGTIVLAVVVSVIVLGLYSLINGVHTRNEREFLAAVHGHHYEVGTAMECNVNVGSKSTATDLNYGHHGADKIREWQPCTVQSHAVDYSSYQTDNGVYSPLDMRLKK